MNGVINFLKPPGMSSNHAVGFFKKLLNDKKIGHAGTLDPGASGVLIILVGKATKLSDYLMNSGKTYVGEIAFGACTDTQDAYGEVIETNDKNITLDMLAAVLPQFVGEIEQTPSRFSAIKVDGKRAYHRARQGEEFTIRSRTVTIEKLTLLEQTANHRFLLEIVCSKGTYIRALFEDIAKALGTCAYMSFLERTQSGGFQAETSITMDEAKIMAESEKTEQILVPIERVLADFPRIEVDSADYKRIANGLDGRITFKIAVSSSGLYRVYCKDVFFGLGSMTGDRAKITTYLLGEDGYEEHPV